MAKYLWSSPQQWLGERIRQDKLSKDEIVELLRLIDGEEIEKQFQAEMEDDLYFTDLEKPILLVDNGNSPTEPEVDSTAFATRSGARDFLLTRLPQNRDATLCYLADLSGREVRDLRMEFPIKYDPTPQFILELWSDFQTVPINSDGTVNEAFYIFRDGTPKTQIWEWFDRKYPHGLVGVIKDWVEDKERGRLLTIRY